MRASTGCDNLDGLLEGGIPSGISTCLFGPPKCGKTLLALQTAVKTSIDEGKPVVYYETEGDFGMEGIPEKYVDFLEDRFGGEANLQWEFLEDAHTMTERFGQKIILDEHEHKTDINIKEIKRPKGSEVYRSLKNSDAAMMFIDSFSEPISELIVSKQQNFPTRASLIKRMTGIFRVIATALDIPIFIISHESRNPADPSDMGKVSGGSSFAYKSKIRIQMFFDKGKARRGIRLRRAPGIFEPDTYPAKLRLEKDHGFVDA